MKKCQKANVSFIEMEEVINKYWISCKDLQVLLPQLTQVAAQREFKIIKDELDSKNEFYFKTRPVLLPVKVIIDKFKIDTKLIRSEAIKIKKGMINNEKEIKC